MTTGHRPHALLDRAAALVAAGHPVPSVAVTVMVAMLALRAGAGARTALVAGAVLSGQLSIGWLNDRIDATRDRTAGRTDKPVASGRLSPRAAGTAAAVAGLVSLALSVPLGAAGVANAVHVAAGYVYDRWAKFRVWSVVPYVVAFGILPSVATLAAPAGGWAPVWMTVAGALLGAGGHIMNVLPDLEEDLAEGVRGFPQILGPGRGLVVATACLGGGALVAASAVTDGAFTVAVVGAVGAVLVLIVGAAAVGRPAVAFRGTILLALATVALLWVAGPP